MRNFVLAFALGFGLSGAANAADTIVAPGLGTLNAAIVAAADGDTLFLQDGTYRMLGTTIAKTSPSRRRPTTRLSLFPTPTPAPTAPYGLVTRQLKSAYRLLVCIFQPST